jgi:hypothetical protein
MRILLLSLTVLVASPAGAQTELKEHAYELPKVNPAAMRTLRGELPSRLKSVPWIYDLKGVGMPMIGVTLSGQPYLGGLMCQPHDCGDNKFAYLVTRDGKRAVGLVRSVNVPNAKRLLIGGPRPDEVAMLEKLLD